MLAIQKISFSRCLDFLLIMSLLVIASNSFAQAMRGLDNSQKAKTTIAFGSCSHQDKPLTILQTIADESPDAMLFLGDNIYGDTDDLTLLNQKYGKLGANPNFQLLKRQTSLHAIWDDHDYGKNDAGKEFHFKHQAKDAFLQFWEVASDDRRIGSTTGIYHSKEIMATNGRLVRIIFPDLRWNRDELSGVGSITYYAMRKPKNMGPYKKDESGKKSMLGDTQWQWLEQELGRPADIIVLASSLQVLSDFTGWEAWQNYPYDLNRLKDIIAKKKLDNLIIVSGDTHWGELSNVKVPIADDKAIDLWEVTSSGLSEEWKDISPNINRVGEAHHTNNYGLIEISWEEDSALLTFGIKDESGQYLEKSQNQVFY